MGIWSQIQKLIPFKKGLYALLKKNISFPEKIYRHLYFENDFEISTPFDSSFKLNHPGSGFVMETDFFWKGFGGTEKISCHIWTEVSRNSSIILDIGGHTGIYSLMAASVNPKSNIILFEPNPDLVKLCKKNIQLNNYSIQVESKAVYNKSTSLYLNQPNIGDHYTFEVSDSKSQYSQAIQCVSLFDYIKENKLTNIDLIKIDVEGNEWEVLEGMKEYLPLFKPVLLIEILTDTLAEKLHELLSPLDYQFYNIDENKGLIKREKIEKAQVENFLICTKENFEKFKLDKFLI